MGGTLIRGGTLVTMDEHRRVVEGDLLIEDGCIQAIGEVPPRLDVDVLDATGKFVLPGFIQGHVHLGQSLLRGLCEDRELMDWLRERTWPLEAAHDHASAYWSAMLGAADCLLSGTTTIQEIGLVHHMEAIFEAISESGLRAIAGQCLMDRGLGVPSDLIQPTRVALDETRVFHRKWHGAAEGRIQTLLCPRFILSCSEALWEGVVELAAELGLPVHTHLLEHPREEIEVRDVLGTTQMGYLDALGVLDCDLRIAHGVQFGREQADVLAGRSMSICHCPSANLKLGSGIADLGFLQSVEGITVGIGCDGAPCNNDMDILEEIRLAALLQGVRQGPGRFSALQALELATIEGARAIGLAHRIGSLEVGKAGDVVVLDLDKPATFGPVGVSPYSRIVYAAARDAVCWVLIAGRIVVDRGRLTLFDEEALKRRPGEEVRRLLARARV